MKLKKTETKLHEENLIPLINIVFLMLIFFLVAGAVRTFSSKDIKLSVVEQSEKLNSQAVKLHISKQGEIFLNGIVVAKENLSREISLLKELVKDLEVSILPDKALRAEMLIEVIEIVRQQGVKTLHLVAIKKKVT